MNILLDVAILVVVTSVAVVAMLLVRRTAPDGSYFHDGDRAAGVFGVLATGFSVLLGFVVFLAFTSYDAARTGAETGGAASCPAGRDGPVLPAAGRPARSPASWSATPVRSRACNGTGCRRGRSASELNPWAIELFRTLRTVSRRPPTEQSAYDEWLDQTVGARGRPAATASTAPSA